VLGSKTPSIALAWRPAVNGIGSSDQSALFPYSPISILLPSSSSTQSHNILAVLVLNPLELPHRHIPADLGFPRLDWILFVRD